MLIYLRLHFDFDSDCTNCFVISFTHTHDPDMIISGFELCHGSSVSTDCRPWELVLSFIVRFVLGGIYLIFLKFSGASPPKGYIYLPLLSDLFLDANLLNFSKIFGGSAPKTLTKSLTIDKPLSCHAAQRTEKSKSGIPMKSPGYGPATQWNVLRVTPPNAAAAANFSLAAADNGKSRRRASLCDMWVFFAFPAKDLRTADEMWHCTEIFFVHESVLYTGIPCFSDLKY
jgi:hypothetical protein